MTALPKCLALVLAVLLLSSPARAGEAVGSVRDVSGDVTVTHKGQKQPEKLRHHDGIRVGDKIRTGERSHVRLRFADKAEITVAEKGTFTVDKYRHDPENPAKDRAVFTVLKAAFSYVGGLMDKAEKPDVTLQLDYGSIGIRGTKVMAARKGRETWVYLRSGNIDVYNRAGNVSLNPGEGTVLKGERTAPALPHVWSPREIAWIKAAASGKDGPEW